MKLNRRDLMTVGTFTGFTPLLPTEKEKQEGRRVMLFLVDPAEILSLFYGPHEYVSIDLDRSKAPADAKVLGVDYDYSRGCFRLLVSSQEFEPQPLGAPAPIVDELIHLQREVLRRVPGGGYSRS